MRPNPRPSLALLLVAACGSSGGGSSTGPAGKRVGPVLAAMLAGADRTRAPWRCAAADLPTLPDESISAGKRSWRLGGHALRLADDKVASIAIGIVADAGGAAPATLAALGRLAAKLDVVDLVITLGGMGSTQEELLATLGTLGSATRPILALPGDLENVRTHIAVIAALREKQIPAIDGRLVRWVELPNATLGTAPGMLGATRLASSEGCELAAGDATAVFAELANKPGLRIAASVEAPRVGLARGELTGDLALAATGQIDLHVYGAGELATAKRDGKRDGTAVAVSPGASDATTRLADRRGPSAGILTLRDETWSWTPIFDTP